MSEQFVGCAQKQPLRGLIKEAWRHAAKTLGTAPWKLDEPIWTVGSKLCSQRKCRECPVEDLCDKTKGVRCKENAVIWKSEKDIHQKTAPSTSARHTSSTLTKKPVRFRGKHVVFEDLAKAIGLKVHHITCVYYKR